MRKICEDLVMSASLQGAILSHASGRQGNPPISAASDDRDDRPSAYVRPRASRFFPQDRIEDSRFKGERQIHPGHISVKNLHFQHGAADTMIGVGDVIAS
jgi:hypothetical protein